MRLKEIGFSSSSLSLLGSIQKDPLITFLLPFLGFLRWKVRGEFFQEVFLLLLLPRVFVIINYPPFLPLPPLSLLIDPEGVRASPPNRDVVVALLRLTDVASLFFFFWFSFFFSSSFIYQERSLLVPSFFFPFFPLFNFLLYSNFTSPPLPFWWTLRSRVLQPSCRLPALGFFLFSFCRCFSPPLLTPLLITP